MFLTLSSWDFWFLAARWICQTIHQLIQPIQSNLINSFHRFGLGLSEKRRRNVRSLRRASTRIPWPNPAASFYLCSRCWRWHRSGAAVWRIPTGCTCSSSAVPCYHPPLPHPGWKSSPPGSWRCATGDLCPAGWPCAVVSRPHSATFQSITIRFSDKSTMIN